MAKKIAKKDYDKDGKVESPSDEYKGVKDKAIKKAKFSKGKAKGKMKPKAKGNPFAKKEEEEMVSEASGVVKFINAISSKNYAQANKYLKGIMASKIENRISASLNEPLF